MPSAPASGGCGSSADGILALSPNLEGDPSQFGGILVVILLHEYGHADGTYVKTSLAGRACDHVQLVHEVAARNCQLVWLICHEIPGANVEPLCTFYRDIHDGYNNVTDGNRGASAAPSSAIVRLLRQAHVLVIEGHSHGNPPSRGR